MATIRASSGWRAYYDEALQGEDGKILTYTDARGVEVAELGEVRLEPEAGDDLYVSLDYNISRFATQLAEQTMQRHQASGVEIIVMNPKNGEIYTMVNVPEFSLQEPFTLTEYMAGQTGEKTDLLNEMWRNICISDTYEPGSTFKIITTAAALEEGVVTPEESFYCNGSITVEGYADPLSQDNGTWERGFYPCHHRIPAIRSLSSWDCAWERRVSFIILNSSRCFRRPGSTCPAKERPSCTS